MSSEEQSIRFGFRRVFGNGSWIITVIIFFSLGVFPVSGALSKELIDDLHHPDWEVRYQAALNLGKEQNKTAVEPLIESLFDQERIVRDSAALALSRIGGKAAEEKFLKLLSSGNSQTRARAALALGRMRTKIALEPLLEYLGDENWLVRWSVVLALGMIGEEAALPGLEKALGDEYYDSISKEYPVREAARSSLAKINARRQSIVYLKADLQKHPRNAGKILSLAEAYLGEEDETKAIRLLKKLIKLNSLEKEYKSRALFDLAYAYGQTGKQEKSQALFQSLLDKYPDFEEADKAYYALGILYHKLGDKAKALAALEKLLENHPESKLVWEARTLIKEIRK